MFFFYLSIGGGDLRQHAHDRPHHMKEPAVTTTIELCGDRHAIESKMLKIVKYFGEPIGNGKGLPWYLLLVNAKTASSDPGVTICSLEKKKGRSSLNSTEPRSPRESRTHWCLFLFFIFLSKVRRTAGLLTSTKGQHRRGGTGS